MDKQILRIYYLYRATNQVNGKVYIGQTVDTNRRWAQHRKASAEVPFHFAIKKHGIDNFIFEVIATCKSYDDANELETLLVQQYDCYIFDGKGYNATKGGFNAPKSEECKEKLRKATFKQIKEQGHPSLGKKRTDEQRAHMSYVRNKYPINYTPEMREMFSRVHSGRKQSEESIQKRVASIAKVTRLRHEKETAEGKWKCNAPGCDVVGPPEPPKDKYGFYNNERYCLMHLGRLKYHGTVDKLPPHRPFGHEAPNKKKFTQEQIKKIMTDPRGAARVGKDFGVSDKVIWRIRRENK